MSSTPETNSGVLSSFEQSSVRCITRQEECFLKTAVAMAIVKERLKKRRCRDEGRDTGKHEQQMELSGLPSFRNTSLLDTLWSPGIPIASTHTLRPRLLQYRYQDHMDHLFQVACNLATTATRTGESELYSRSSSSSNSKSAQLALNGAASHLVQQLSAWMDQTTATRKDHNDRQDTLLEDSPNVSSDITNLRQVQEWIASTIISHPCSVIVHQTMILNSPKPLADALWWEVVPSLLFQVYFHSFPQNNVDGGTVSDTMTSIINTRPFRSNSSEENSGGTTSNCSFPIFLSWAAIQESYLSTTAAAGLDTLAVQLLQMLQTLVDCHNRQIHERYQLDDYSADPNVDLDTTAHMLLPESLMEVLLPFPSLVNLGREHWKLANEAPGTSGYGPSGVETRHKLSPGARLLLRLELYRILLLNPVSM